MAPPSKWVMLPPASRRSRSPSRSPPRSVRRSLPPEREADVVAPRPPSKSVLLPASRRSRSPSRSPPRSVSPSPKADVVAPDGYWQCVECRSLNSCKGRGNMFCSHCNCHKPLQSAWKAGDWYCELCGNHNYAGRHRCNNNWCESKTTKPGDWICDKCCNHNYSSRLVCNSKTCKGKKLLPAY